MHSSSPKTQPLLVELLTEELPPLALQKLDQAFADGLAQILASHHLLADGCQLRSFATPRRLAVLFDKVLEQAPDQAYTERLMPAHIGLSDGGSITPALARRLVSKGLEHVTAADLTVESDGKQDFVFYRGTATGSRLGEGLQQALDHTLTHLPIPKVMRYQLDNGDSVRFVRPAHGLLALWGDQVIPVHALGLSADRQTSGHRFAGLKHLRLPRAEQYEDLLRSQGQVVASFAQRRAMIATQLYQQAQACGASLGDDPAVDALLDEVTALVELPSVYVGQFDPAFLDVPAECLILTMRLNQRYFPLFHATTGELANQFLIVSNMALSDPTNIIEGNERVVRPRLADAQFFFETDLQTSLGDQVATLKNSIYHNRLGSQYERMQRVRTTAGWLAEKLGANVPDSRRAAELAKADLNSAMVGEFPELQGIMGSHYAAHGHESTAVVQALRHQYDLRLPAIDGRTDLVTAVLFMAERVETLLGIWGIGQKPTGERDPFGLRRAALGLISAFEQLTEQGYLDATDNQALGLTALLDQAMQTFSPGTLAGDTVTEVHDYIIERYRNQLQQQHDRHVVDAVLAVAPPLHQITARIQACTAFSTQPEASSLTAANKRVSNILRRASDIPAQIQPDLLVEPAEQKLAGLLDKLAPEAAEQLAAGNFAANLTTLAGLRDAVDGFFDQVMIMSDDESLKQNRLTLLARLQTMMNQVADISRLAS